MKVALMLEDGEPVVVFMNDGVLYSWKESSGLEMGKSIAFKNNGWVVPGPLEEVWFEETVRKFESLCGEKVKVVSFYALMEDGYGDFVG